MSCFISGKLTKDVPETRQHDLPKRQSCTSSRLVSFVIGIGKLLNVSQWNFQVLYCLKEYCWMLIARNFQVMYYFKVLDRLKEIEICIQCAVMCECKVCWSRDHSGSCSHNLKYVPHKYIPYCSTLPEDKYTCIGSCPKCIRSVEVCPYLSPRCDVFLFVVC